MKTNFQDESELVAQKIENEELNKEVDRLTNQVDKMHYFKVIFLVQLRVKNQELFDCRMTVAEFSLLIPKLEEQVNFFIVN